MIQMIVVNTPAPDHFKGNESEEVVKRFLDQKIIEDVFTPYTDDVKRIPTGINGKGLYFWFMHIDGYKKLSPYVNIASVNPVYEKDIDGKKYHLVYVGSAKGKTVSLRSRLKEHINQQHNEREICSGFISTFRAGLGALISEDLILYPNSTTSEEVNYLLHDFFKVFWIVSRNNELEHIAINEETIIKKLKPLLNLDFNQNANIPNQPTFIYKVRKAIVKNNTQNRLGC